MELILATASCHPSVDIICAPTNVNELFEFRQAIFHIGTFPITRSVVLIMLIALIVSLVLFFGLRKKAVVPGKFQPSVEGIISFVQDGIATEIIGEKWTLLILRELFTAKSYENLKGRGRITFDTGGRIEGWGWVRWQARQLAPEMAMATAYTRVRRAGCTMS